MELKIAGVVLAVLVVATGAAAALPGNAPVDAPTEQASDNADAGNGDADADASESDDTDESGMEQSDDSAANASGAADERDGAAANASEAADERGPPSEMSSQVPEFVGDIHDLIQQKIDGTVSSLGEQISSLTPGGDSGGDAESGASNAPTDGAPAQ